MRLSGLSRGLILAASGVVLAILWAPLFVIALYAFNDRRVQSWPIKGFSLQWFGKAIDNPGVRHALLTSLEIAVCAAAVALILGTLLSLAVHRFSFFGRTALSFVVVLPIALPGIVTGMALNATFRTELFGVSLKIGLLTVIIGHSTFCIVILFNNVIARMRRVQGSLEEAAMDLGAGETRAFLDVTLPQLRGALLAGALLAFALSWDEIVVTTFTAGVGIETLPQWILNNLSRPNQLPIVNVVALGTILLSAIPVYLATRLSADAGAPLSAIDEP
ncbi:MAG: ABC transporter permease [Gaiellales bacterium]